MARVTYAPPRYNFGDVFIETLLQSRRLADARAAEEALMSLRVRDLNERIRAARENERLAQQLQALRERTEDRLGRESDANIDYTRIQTGALQQQTDFNEQLNPIRLRTAETEAEAAELGLDLERRFGAAQRQADIGYRGALSVAARSNANVASPSTVDFLSTLLGETDAQINAIDPKSSGYEDQFDTLMRQRLSILNAAIEAGQRGADLAPILDLYNQSSPVTGGQEVTGQDPQAQQELDWRSLPRPVVPNDSYAPPALLVPPRDRSMQNDAARQAALQALRRPFAPDSMVARILYNR